MLVAFFEQRKLSVIEFVLKSNRFGINESVVTLTMVLLLQVIELLK